MFDVEDLRRLAERMNTKLDKIEEHLGAVDVTLTKQNADLELHIYRTGIAEQRIEMLQSEVEPISKTHQKMMGVFKFIGMGATAITLIGTVVKIMEYFKLF